MSQNMTDLNAEITGEKLELDRFMSMGWEVYKHHFRSIAILVLIVAVPLDLLLYFMPSPASHVSSNAGLLLIQVVSGIIGVIFSSLSFIAIYRLIESSLQGDPISWQEAFRHALSRWGASLATWVTAWVILVGMTLLLVVPGIIWSVYYSFLLMVVSVRDLSGKAALDYSKQLVKGRWWRVFGFQTVFMLFPLTFSFAMKPIVELFAAFPFALLVASLVYAIFFVYTLTMSMLFFLNLEARSILPKRRTNNESTADRTPEIE
jgi:hypothetical protein